MVINVPVKLVTGGLAKMLADALRLTADAGANGMLGAVHAALCTGPTVFTQTLDEAGITEAVYGGYARQALVWGAPGTDPTGRPAVLAGSLLFKPTDSTASSRVVAAAILSAAAAGTLYGYGILGSAATLATGSDELNLALKVAMPLDPADWGTGAAIN